MYYSREKRICFVLPPRTGSTSILKTFAPYNFIGKLGDHHATMNEINAAVGDIEYFRFYTVFRNPFDRLISTLNFSVARNNGITSVMDPTERTKITGSYLSKIVKNQLYKKEFMPQVEWYDTSRINVLDFDNYSNEIKKVAESIGISNITVAHENTFPKAVEMTDDIRDFVKYYYAKDFEFGQKVLGKTYW